MRVPHARIRGVIRKCAEKLLPPAPVVSVALLGEREMTSINEAYTGRRGTTDVLSFPLGRDAHDGKWYGEILISLPRAGVQAKEKGVSLANEVVRLLIHAMAHLGGCDHHDMQGFVRMRRLELELLLECL